jgi:hypothetical protein
MTPTHCWPCAVRLAVLLVVPLLLGPGTALGQGAKKSDAFVKVSTSADKPDADGKQLVTVKLEIDKPWHAYANPVGNEDLADAATKVTIAKNDSATIEYPTGTVVKDPVLGSYKVYEGTVEIKARVRRAADAGPLEVAVRFQVCDDKKCLPPATVKVSVP